MPDSGLGLAQWRLIVVVTFSTAVCSAHVSTQNPISTVRRVSHVVRVSLPQMVISAFIEREPTLICSHKDENAAVGAQGRRHSRFEYLVCWGR